MESGKNDPRVQWRLEELQKSNKEFKEARMAALNLMEDAILSEQALRQSEARYRFLFDNMDQGVQICELVRNEDNRVTGLDVIHVNPAWINITRLGPVAGNEKRNITSLPVLDQPWFWYCEQVKESGMPSRFETKMNGDSWLDLFVTRMEGDRFMLLLTDITERKRRDANQSFLAYCSASLLKVDSVSDIVNAIGKNAHAYFGAAACTILKTDVKQDSIKSIASWQHVYQPVWAGKLRFSAFIAEVNRDQLLQGFPLIETDTGLARNVPGDPELTIMRAFLYIPIIRNQELKYILCIYHPHPYQWLSDQVSLLNELAGRIWNKMARLEAEEKLKTSEENYKAIVNQSVSGIFKLTIDGFLTFANDYFAKMLGYDLGELLQMTVRDIVHPDDLEKTFANFNHMVETGQSFEVQKRLLRKDRAVLWVTNYVAPLFDGKQNPVGAVVVSVDISRQKEMEQQKDEFISIASHELKTPLTSVKAYGQLVQQASRDGNPEELAEMIAKMNFHTDRLVNLVGAILDTTRLERQEFSIVLQKMDIDELISEKIKESQLVAPHFNIVFNDCTASWIYGDKISLGQVLTNLISNAIKYSPHGSTITVDCQHTEQEVKVSVTDEGIGISEKDQEKIFEKYYRSVGLLESGRSGIGLGLYLCAEIIRRHHGTMGVTSALGKGTTFYFTIPHSIPNQL